MIKWARCITCAFFLLLGAQWALRDPPDIVTLGSPDTDEEVLDDGEFVRPRLSLPPNSHWPTPSAELALHADSLSIGGLALPGDRLASTDPNAPQSPPTLHRIARSPPAA